MTAIAQKRCLNHETREAVCRCPECRNFFCRECVVPFESRLLCAPCLAQHAGTSGPEATKSFTSGWFALATTTFLLAWLLFYLAGWLILQAREHYAG